MDQKIGEGGFPRVLHSPSTCSSLAFVDVAFADLSGASGGSEHSSIELHERDAADVECECISFPLRSCSGLGAPQQSLEDPEGRTRRPSLASRFFLREFLHGDPQADAHSDSEASRRSNCSTECIDLVISGDSPSGQEQPRDDAAIFPTDPAEKVRYSSAATSQLLWATGGLLLVLVSSTATVLHYTLSLVYSSRVEGEEAVLKAIQESQGDHQVSPPQQQLPLFLEPTQWLPTQAAADVLYGLLVLVSTCRWLGLQRRLRVVVFVRFLVCLFWALTLKVVLSAAFVSSYLSTGVHMRCSSYADLAALALRFVLGLTLTEDADSVPGYGRMLTSQLFIFWCLYTRHKPALLVAPSALSLSILFLGSVYHVRSVFDVIVTFALVSSTCLFYHFLLDSAARAVFLKLRADMGTREAQLNNLQVQQRLPAVYTPAQRLCCLSATASRFYGYSPQGSFIPGKLWDSLSLAAGRVEFLEERVRFALRSYGLFVAQQHNVHFVPPAHTGPQHETQGLPVAFRKAASGEVHIVVDDRMIWATVCECYSPRPPTSCAMVQRVRSVALSLRKCRQCNDAQSPPSS